MLFCVIYRTHICRSCVQRQILATLSLIINKKRKKQRIKQDSNIFASISQEFDVSFLKLHNLQSINWPRPDQLGLTWNSKLAIFEIKSIFEQQNRKNIKQEHSAFIVAYFSIFIVSSKEWGLLDPSILLNLWTSIIQVSQHLSMLYVPKFF